MAGAWLGGQREALLVQSSGAGNCIKNLALNATTRIPLLMLVTMRGGWANSTHGGTACALLLGQRLVREKKAEMMTNELNDRRAAAARLLIGRENLPVITGLGSPTYDVMAAGDDDNNFYLSAVMGSAATVGLGIQARSVGLGCYRRWRDDDGVRSACDDHCRKAGQFDHRCHRQRPF